MAATTVTRRFIQLIIIVFAVCFLTGCSNSVNKDYVLNKDSGKGLIILTTTETGQHWPVKPDLCYRPIGKKYGKSFPMWDRQFLGTNKNIAPLWLDWFTPHIPDDNAIGYIHAIELPAGEYEFHTYIATLYAPNMSVTYRPTKDFSWKFQVEAGKARYLGNVNFFNTGQSFAQTIVSLNDEKERDFKLMAEKYKNINVNEITITLLRKSPGDTIPVH